MDTLLLLKFFGGLFLVLGLIFLVFWVSRKLHPGLMQKNKNAFTLKEAFVIDPKNRMVVIAYDNCDYVFLLGANNSLLLDKKPIIENDAK